jgi:hypothetical protein
VVTEKEKSVTEDAIEKAVEEDLAIELKTIPFRPIGDPAEPVVHKHTQINGNGSKPAKTVEDPHKTWLALGEKLHDQQAARVDELGRRYDAAQSELVAKVRERDQIAGELLEAESRLALFRSRLGYGQ